MDGKIWIAGLLLMFAGAAAFTAGAAEKNAVEFKSVKISMREALPPQMKVSNMPATRSSSRNPRWRVLDIEYTPVTGNGDAAGKNVKSPVWLDGVHMQATMIIPAETEAGKLRFTVFEGATVFDNVEVDNQMHQAVMLVQPVLFRRYAKSRSEAGDVIYLRVTFRDGSGNELGQAYGCYPRGREKEDDIAERFRRFTNGRTLRTYRVIPNSILSRPDSPWNVVDANSDPEWVFRGFPAVPAAGN